MPYTPARRAVRRWAPLLIALAFGAWEICFAGFMADDFFQLIVLEELVPESKRPSVLDLYTLADGDPIRVLAMKDAGLIPWFFDPEFKMEFFRPLSSALLALDHAVFGLHPSGYRLHGVVWSVLLVAGVTAVYRRSLPRRVATVAAVVFVLSGIHGIFSWTAARHVVIAAALGMAALVAHMRWRADGWRPGAVLAVVALTLSLAASEVGMAMVAYIVAYEALGSDDQPRARIRAVLPTLLIVALYLTIWTVRGHGASAGSGYLDPVHQPLQFIFELPRRLAVLVGSVVLGGNADLWVLRPDLRTLHAIAGAAATLVLLLVLRSGWTERARAERQALGWLGVGAVLSAIPFAGTPIGSRCVLVPLIGGAPLIAAVIERWWTLLRSRPGMHVRPLGIACVVLVLIHIVLAPIGRLASPILLKVALSARAAAVVRDAELDSTRMASQTAVILVAPDLIVGLHGGVYPTLYREPRPAAWRVLSWAHATHRFERTGDDTLEMTIDGKGIESIKLRAGMSVALRDLEATVLAVGDLGPTRVRFRFQQSLDAPALALLTWRDERLQRIAPPPVGGTFVIER